MTPTLANGQTDAATYHRAGDGTYHALGLAILTVTPAGITRITGFGDPSLVAGPASQPPTRDTGDDPPRGVTGQRHEPAAARTNRQVPRRPRIDEDLNPQ
jgi:hypothetical protein